MVGVLAGCEWGRWNRRGGRGGEGKVEKEEGGKVDALLEKNSVDWCGGEEDGVVVERGRKGEGGRRGGRGWRWGGYSRKREGEGKEGYTSKRSA